MQQEISCPKCGAQNLAGQQFCGACGAKLVVETPRQTVACPKCGTQNPAGQQFCGVCGAKLAAEMPMPQQDLSKAIDNLLGRSQIKVNPTWGLAWGLLWRMLLLSLLIGTIIYLIVMLIMLASGSPLSFGAA